MWRTDDVRVRKIFLVKHSTKNSVIINFSLVPGYLVQTIWSCDDVMFHMARNEIICLSFHKYRMVRCTVEWVCHSTVFTLPILSCSTKTQMRDWFGTWLFLPVSVYAREILSKLLVKTYSSRSFNSHHPSIQIFLLLLPGCQGIFCSWTNVTFFHRLNGYFQRYVTNV